MNPKNPNTKNWTQKDVEKLIKKKDANCRRYLEHQKAEILGEIEKEKEKIYNSDNYFGGKIKKVDVFEMLYEIQEKLKKKL